MISLSDRFSAPLRVALICALAGTIAQPVLADASSKTQSASDEAKRLDLTNRLRVLSQSIPAAVCNAQAGIAADSSLAALQAAATEFETTLTGLKSGDDTLGLAAETVPRVQDEIAAVTTVWEPLNAMLESALDDATGTALTPAVVTVLGQRSDTLLKAAEQLTYMMTAEYRDPTSQLQAMMLTIDIAGRQRMLSQRISGMACLEAEGRQVEAAKAEIGAAMQLYESSLTALRDGMPAAGIIAPPTERIATDLDAVHARWTELTPVLGRFADGDIPDADARVSLLEDLDLLTREMDAIVALYLEENRSSL